MSTSVAKGKHEKKIINVVNRTTSETLRLGETTTNGPHSIQTLPPVSRKKIQNSSSSFQITGVSLTRSDFGGDDSADDLDESHTDDISRVTDNETPSFSEDSRDTDEPQGCCVGAFGGGYEPQQQIPVNTAPTTQVCGLTPKELMSSPPSDVRKDQSNASGSTSNNINNNNNINNGNSKPPAGEDTGARFKVVKMPSVTPFTRGRWTCFDYLDNPNSNLPGFVYARQVLDNQGARQSQDAAFPPAEYSPNVYLVPPNASGSVPCGKGVEAGVAAAAAGKVFNQSYFPLLSAGGMHMGEHHHFQPSDNANDILSDIKVALTSTSVPSDTESAPNNNNIDKKIEEALDAVKTHLMVAVHKEVDFLKTRVSTLEGRVNELEIENSILRVNYLLFKS